MRWATDDSFTSSPIVVASSPWEHRMLWWGTALGQGSRNNRDTPPFPPWSMYVPPLHKCVFSGGDWIHGSFICWWHCSVPYNIQPSRRTYVTNIVRNLAKWEQIRQIQFHRDKWQKLRITNKLNPILATTLSMVILSQLLHNLNA